MKLRWSVRAGLQLQEISDYIALDDPIAALRWVRKLDQRVRSVANTPRAGRRVPELERDDIREVFLGAYRILYRIAPRELVVIAVFEGHRLIPDDVDPDTD